MKTKNLIKTSLFALMLFLANIIQGQNTISGSVADAENGEGIPGANIIVIGSNTGAASDFDGNFSFSTSQEYPFTLEISSIGFGSKTVEVTSADQTISVELNLGQNLSEIVVTASRRREKVQEAPASVSIITSRDIANSSAPIDPMKHLLNIPGVTVQQHSANSLNIEMRGGNGLFGTAVLPMLDYRFMTTPAAGNLFSFQTGLSNLDIDRVEVVRGAGSALYGPGVTSGVVHFLSKKPIDFPGTTAELYGGTMSTFGGAVRHAYANDSKTFGYKINFKYSKGDDFTIDPTNAADAAQIAGFNTTIRQPIIKNKVVDAVASLNGPILLDKDDLDPDGDGNMLSQEYKNVSVNAHLEFRPSDLTSAFISAGLSNGGGIFVSDLGFAKAQGNDYWIQSRIQSGGFFASLNYNANDGGDEKTPTFLYSTGFRQVTKRVSMDASIQYNFDTPGFLNTNFTVGLDYRDTALDSEYTLFGRNEDDDAYKISGVYLQGTSALGEKIDLTYAIRYDKLNFLKDGAFAPRIALVYKANENNTFRVSYNVSTSGPTALQTYIDFPVQTLSAGVLDVWLAGQITEQRFPSTPTVEWAGAPASFPAIPASAVTGYPAALAYGRVAGGVLPLLLPGLAANPATAPLYPAMAAFFGSYQGPVGFVGSVFPYNVFNLSEGAITDFPGAGAARWTTIDNFEVGYKGVIGSKLAVAVDFYTYSVNGSTDFTGLGATYGLMGANGAQVSVANDLGAAVFADFSSDPGILATINGGVALQYAALGYPVEGNAAFGIPSLAASQAGTVAGTMAALAPFIQGSFTSAGQLFDAAIAEGGAYAALGTTESLRMPQGDGVTHITAGYRDYPNAKRSHYGMDYSLEYFANDNVTFWGNYSMISQNVWIPGESDDDGLETPSYLNTPENKYRMGVKFNANNGLRGGLAYQHDDAFFSVFGTGFGGQTPAKDLVDANIGMPISKKIYLDLSATNLFDVAYRSYPGMPVIKRRVILKATIDL
jgi:outer membrane receptor for ferrienterochelin and colicins